MLILGSRLIKSPIMSLQTGGQLAVTTRAIINPDNLRIAAYEVSGPLLNEHPSFLRVNEIREYGKIGIIVDSSDDLIGLGDVIEIERLHKLGFPLIGMDVFDEQKKKLGKVEDYTLDTIDYLIQQLNVKRGFFHGFNDTGMLIHRSQIVEINNNGIIVKSATKRVEQPVMTNTRLEYVNPFRTNPQPEVEAID